MTLADDRGSGTLLGLLAALLVMCGGAVAWSFAGLAVTHQRASVSADLAAIAAAQSGCSAAQRVAEANGATLEECSLEGSDAVVAVSVPGPRALMRLGLPAVRMSGSARAGVAE